MIQRDGSCVSFREHKMNTKRTELLKFRSFVICGPDFKLICFRIRQYCSEHAALQDTLPLGWEPISGTKLRLRLSACRSLSTRSPNSPLITARSLQIPEDNKKQTIKQNSTATQKRSYTAPLFILQFQIPAVDQITIPPFTPRIWPVMKEALSEARNATAFAMS